MNAIFVEKKLKYVIATKLYSELQARLHTIATWLWPIEHWLQEVIP